MKIKKIYPFKKFVRNIILGLSLVVLAFSAGPIFNAIQKPVEAATANPLIYIYQYQNDGKAKQISSTTKITTSAGKTNYALSLKENDNSTLFYLSTSSNSTNVDDTIWTNFLSLGIASLRRTLTVGSTYYFNYHQSSTYNCVGFFTKSSFNASNVIGFGNSFTYNGQENIYILIAPTDYKININFSNTKYLQVGNYSWESSFMTSTCGNSNLNLSYASLTPGGSITIPSVNNYTRYFTFTDKYNEPQTILLSGTYNVFWNSKGVIQFYNKNNPSSSQAVSVSTSGGNATIDFSQVTYEPNDEPNEKNPYLKYEDGKAVFYLSNASDVVRFADEVNAGEMNAALRSNYKAVLTSNITIKLEDRFYGIGEGEKEFLGEFDGQGKNISATIRINSSSRTNAVKTQSYMSAGLLHMDYYYRGILDSSGFFNNAKGANIHDLKITNLQFKSPIYKHTMKYALQWVDIFDGIASWEDYITPGGDNSSLGGLCGSAENTTIKNVKTDGFTTKIIHVEPLDFPWSDRQEYTYIGGMCGSASNSTMENCIVGKIDGSSEGENKYAVVYAGMLAGILKDGSKIKNSCALNQKFLDSFFVGPTLTNFHDNVKNCYIIYEKLSNEDIQKLVYILGDNFYIKIFESFYSYYNSTNFIVFADQPSKSMEDLLNLSNSSIYGYNSSINPKTIYNAYSAPFLLSHASGTYANVIIDCAGRNVPINQSDGSFYESHLTDQGRVTGINRLYGTALSNGLFYSGGRKRLQFPSITNKSGVPVSYYSQDEEGGNIFAYPGESVLEKITGSKTVILYPIFKPSITLYSPVELKLSNNTTNGVTYNGVTYSLTKDNNYSASSSYYQHKYVLTVDAGGDGKEDKTLFNENVLTSIISKPSATDGYNLCVSENKLSSTTVEYVNYSQLSTYEDYAKFPTFKNNGSYCVNFFKEVELNYINSGTILTKDGDGKYSLSTYDSSLSVYMFYNTTYNLSGIQNVKGFGDLKNDEGKVVYSPKGFGTSKDYIVVDANTNIPARGNVNEIGNALYYKYTTNGVNIKYHSATNGGEEIVFTYLRPTTGSEKENIKSYAEVFGVTNYAFVGWKYCIYDDTKLEFELFLTKKTNIIIGEGDECVNIDLYPVFVEKNGSALSITEGLKRGGFAGPYQIKTAEDLIKFSYMINWEAVFLPSFKLNANIDMDGYKNFLPIGFSDNNSFNGIFDGNGYTISNLTISDFDIINKVEIDSLIKSYRANTIYLGLFGYLGASATLKNFNLVNIDYKYEIQTYTATGANSHIVYCFRKSEQIYIGGVAGYSLSDISNVAVSGNISSIYSGYLGGIVGYSSKNIGQCVSKIYSTQNVGSIAGQVAGTIKNCFDIYTGSEGVTSSVKAFTSKSAGGIQNSYSAYSGTDTATVKYGRNGNKSVVIGDISGDSKIWAQSNEINNGNPYLKKTGIVSNYFTINADYENRGYLLTENDKINLDSCKESDTLYRLTKNYFIFDEYSYDSNLAQLKINDEKIFNSLEGYDFEGYDKNSDGKVDVKDKDSAEFYNVFINNKETYNLIFTANNVKLKYIINYNNEDKSINEKSVEFASKQQIEDQTKNLLKYLKGYKIVDYSVYDEHKNVGDEFVINHINEFIVKANIEKVNYKLNFYDENEKLYEGDAYTVIAGYGSNITLPNPEKTGYTFTGWAFGDNKLFNYTVMPELRDEPFNAKEDENGHVALDLYSTWTPNDYTITYIYEENGKNIKLIQNVKYDEDVTLYSDIEGNNQLYIYGYVLDSFYFKDSFILENKENIIKDINSSLNNGTYKYTISQSIVLYCNYVRDNFNITINGNTDNFKIYYDVTDYETNVITSNLLAENVGVGYRITSKYLDKINIHTYLSNGARIDSITNDSSLYTFNFANFNSFDSYFNELSLLANIKATLNKNIVFDFITSSINLKDINEVESIVDEENGYAIYNVNSTEDLFTVISSENFMQGINSTIKLNNNLDLTGYKFNIPNFAGIFDGNGYSINGFTTFNSLSEQVKSKDDYSLDEEDYSFIGKNSGTIKNLVFNNVLVNVDNFKIIDKTSGNSDNCFGLIGVNSGTIENVYLKTGKISINSNEDLIYVGGLVGKNSNDISFCKVDNLSIKTNSVSCSGLLVGFNADGNVSYSTVNGSIENKEEDSLSGAIVGAILKGTISNIIIEGSSSITNPFAKELGTEFSSARIIIEGDITSPYVYYNNYLKDDNNFILAYNYSENKEKIIIKGLDNQLINVAVNLDNNINPSKLVFKINNLEALNFSNIENKLNLETGDYSTEKLFYVNLNNKLNFKQTSYATVNSVFNIYVFDGSEAEITGNFIVDKYINGEQQNNVVKIPVINGFNISEVSFNVTAQQKTATYKFYTSFLDNFTDEEINQILNGIKISRNDENVEYTYSVEVNSGGVYIYTLSLNDNILYNDDLKINIDLPDYAIMGAKGLQFRKINETLKTIAGSEKQNEFSYTTNIQEDLEFTFEVVRSSLNIEFNLNKDDLFQSEQENIKFSSEFISGNENAFLVNNNLVLRINPELENNVQVYKVPAINGAIDYIYNGINYKLKGFVDENNNYYYNEDLVPQIEKITKNIVLFAIWEAVEYEVYIYNLEDETDYSIVDFTSEDYSIVNKGVSKTFSFAENITLPKVEKRQYNNKYNFVGYVLSYNDVNTQISNKYTLFSDYEILNSYYTFNSNNKVITLIPIFEELSFEVTFYSRLANDSYRTVLIYNEREYDDITLTLNVSKILTNNYTLPIGSREYHHFIGYEKINSSEFITYANDEFQFINIDAVLTLLTSDAQFIAKYNIFDINVTLDYSDCDNNQKLDYELNSINSITNYDYEIDENKNITFVVPYNTTNISLPTITILNDGYYFDYYKVDSEEYTTDYIFTRDVVITIKCLYKVEFYTKNATINSGYYIPLTETDYGYTFTANYSNITLPSESEVIKNGFTLVGYSCEDCEINAGVLALTKPAQIEFIFEGNVYTLILTTSNATLKENLILNNYSKYIESYKVINTEKTQAEIKVGYLTDVANIKNALPGVNCNDGFTFVRYEFSETGDQITSDGTITAVVEQNIYNIYIEENNIRSLFVSKKYNEQITEVYEPQEIEGQTYLGLSLSTSMYSAFNLPSYMPQLEKEYYQVEKTNNIYSLTVYPFYVSNIRVTINANENCKLTNSSNIDSFTGGNAFNSAVSFNITSDNILNNNLIFPTPIVKGELIYATFKGYSFNNGGEDILVVDNNGIMLDTFVFSEYITLDYVFEFNSYNFNIVAECDEISEINGFTKTSQGFVKQIKFNQEVGDLPRISLNNYIFKGYYISLDNNKFVSSSDIQISDENGILFDNYKCFNEIYFNGYEVKNIVAKYDYDYVTVTITSSNKLLGEVNTVKYIDNNICEYIEIENGYQAKVRKGSNIVISSRVYYDVATFSNYLINKDILIEDINNLTTTIYCLTENIEIVANFNYKEFNIIYIVEGNQVEISPIEINGEEVDVSKFNINTEIATEDFAKIVYERTGYNFVGWFKEELFVNQVTNILKGEYRQDLILYGKYLPKQITVTVFTSNVDGYASSENYVAVYNEKMSNMPVLVIDGYNFIGLFTQQNGKGILIDSESKCIYTEDIVLYSYFERVISNTLDGYGTEDNPYLISSEEDFVVFVNLMNNSSKYNVSSKYYKLTKNIALNNEVSIRDFKANFNGDGYAVYLSDKITALNYLNENGKVVTNYGLFNLNEGNINNLILINNVNNISNNDLINILNYGNISGYNNGSITNCIVYYNVELVGDFECNFNSISNNAQGTTTNCSVFNSKLILNGVESLYNQTEDIHLHDKNINAPEILNNSYQISTSEELAYLLSLSSIDKDIELVCDIDMKGKIFSQLNSQIVINGNGYSISNLIVLNQEYLFNNVKLNRVAFEDVVFINLSNEDNYLINETLGVNLSYIKLAINNNRKIIANNNGKITNSYFIGNADYLIETNNAQITNSYVYGMNFINLNNAVNNNSVVITSQDDVNNFINSVDSSIWFKDELLIMNNTILPCLISVGNYVVNFIYDSNIVEIMVYNFNERSRIITKNPTQLLIEISIINSEYYLENILINEISCLNNYKYGLFTIYTDNTKTKNVEFITELKDYTVVYNVDNELGGKVKIDDEEGTTITRVVKSGSNINAQVLVNEGYYFDAWSDGNTDSERTDVITTNETYTASIKQYNTYNLYLEMYSNYSFESPLDVRFVDEEFGYSIKLRQDEDIYNFLPVIIKPDYVFVEYYISQTESNIYYVFPFFMEDYVEVTLNYDNNLCSAIIYSQNEFSSITPSLPIISNQKDSVYTILRNNNIILKITPIYSYLLNIKIDGEDFVYDYSQFVNNENEVEIEIAITKECEISVIMKEILVTTTFEISDSEQCSVDLQNNLFDNNGNVISQKGKQILFLLDISDIMEVDKFLVNDVETEIPIVNGIYSYIPYEDATIKILLKEKAIKVIVNYTEGGKIASDKAFAEINSEDYTNAIEFTLAYNESLTLHILNNDNYVISSIEKIVKDKKQTVEANKFINENVKDNITYNIVFERVSTWLDLDENNYPTHFILQNLKGKGTKSSPYIISSINDFLTIAYNVNVLNNSYSEKYFKSKTQDLTFNFSKYYFESIGNETTNFNGIILGQNLTLKNVKIIGDKNVGLFKTLDSKAIIKSINLDGEILGNYLVGSICGTNNGTILGCSNNAVINSTSYSDSEDNICGGICAINNGIISRTYNNGQIVSNSILTAGICAINNNEINNIYNEGSIRVLNNVVSNIYVAGLVAKNNSNVTTGYNNSIINSTNLNATISGTVINLEGKTSSDLYYNSDRLTTNIGEGKTYEELIDKENEIYANFDFDKIWYFSSYMISLPKLNVMYEYSGSIVFVVTFSDEIVVEEQILMLELSSYSGLNYSIIADNTQKIVTINNLIEDAYTITLNTLVTNTASCEQGLNIVLSEDIGEEVVININVNKVGSKGYYGNSI